MTAQEYLERERLAETKSEFYGGEMFAMDRSNFRHAVIVTNLLGELGIRLKRRPYIVCASNLRLAVCRNSFYTYPDLMVMPDKPALIDEHRDTVTNPIVVVEVLSPSTEGYDRGRKFERYRAIPSLMEYLTVSQHGVHIEIHTRQPDDTWLLRDVRDSGPVKLQSIGVELQLSDIYERVEFTSSEGALGADA